MRKSLVGATALIAGLGLGWTGCAGGASGPGAEAAPGAPEPDDPSYSAYGLTVDRPEGWAFVPVDASVAPDTVVILQGPVGDAPVAPAVEISRRPLNARQQRRPPSHILTQLVMEVVQSFDGFEPLGEPEELEISGTPGAKMLMRFTESLPDGIEVKRGARFYGIVHRGNIWVVRCLGSADGADDLDMDTIVGSIRIES